MLTQVWYHLLISSRWSPALRLDRDLTPCISCKSLFRIRHFSFSSTNRALSLFSLSLIQCLRHLDLFFLIRKTWAIERELIFCDSVYFSNLIFHQRRWFELEAKEQSLNSHHCTVSPFLLDSSLMLCFLLCLGLKQQRPASTGHCPRSTTSMPDVPSRRVSTDLVLDGIYSLDCVEELMRKVRICLKRSS